MFLSVKVSILLVIFHFSRSHKERQLGSLFGKPDWKLKVFVEFLTLMQYFPTSQHATLNAQNARSRDLTP